MPRTIGSLLLAVVLMLVPAAAGSQSSEVSTITDSRIKESSGLVISAQHDDLAYTINDAGNAPIVYAIKISTGDVVGTTRVGGGGIEDSESIAIDGDGTMWVSDLGDNDTERNDVALYSFREPGPGERSVQAKRYPVRYDGGAVDIEAFLIHPKTGAKFLVSKEKKKAGALFALPKKLSTGSANRAEDRGTAMPQDTSDGVFTPDGTQALIRTREAVFVYNPETWEQAEQLSVPEVEQGESIAIEPDGRSFLIGSEGKDSPLIRVAFGPQDEAEPTEPAPSEEPSPTPDTAPATDEVPVPAWLVVVGGLGAVGALAAIGWLVARRL